MRSSFLSVKVYSIVCRGKDILKNYKQCNFFCNLQDAVHMRLSMETKTSLVSPFQLNCCFEGDIVILGGLPQTTGWSKTPDVYIALHGLMRA